MPDERKARWCAPAPPPAPTPLTLALRSGATAARKSTRARRTSSASAARSARISSPRTACPRTTSSDGASRAPPSTRAQSTSWARRRAASEVPPRPPHPLKTIPLSLTRRAFSFQRRQRRQFRIRHRSRNRLGWRRVNRRRWPWSRSRLPPSDDTPSPCPSSSRRRSARYASVHFLDKKFLLSFRFWSRIKLMGLGAGAANWRAAGAAAAAALAHPRGPPLPPLL